MINRNMMRYNRMIYFNLKLVIILFCSVVIGTGCSSKNYKLKTSSTPVCTAKDAADWQFVRDFMQGVSGKDPVGHRIETFAAKRDAPFFGIPFFGKNWYPVDGFKHTLNGKLHHFNFWDPYSSGDEADWNNFFIPIPKFAYLLEEVKPIADSDDLHDCETSDDCFEAEITPDQDFYSNPWFPKKYGDSRDKSPLEGRNICTYGPWVYEEAHGNRPEIHPSELYWWKRSLEGGEIYHLMLLQDDSNRFDREGDYSVSSAPASWRPWSKYPRTGEFKIAFEVNLFPVEPPLTFEIWELRARNVVTSEDASASKDSDDGKDHAIEYDGRVILKVREMQPKDDDIGVRFENVCRNASNTRLKGYVTITSKIGKGDRGDEGYHVLAVAAGQEKGVGPLIGVRPPFIEPEPPRFVATGKTIEDSIYRGTEDTKPQLFADIQFEISGDAKATDAELTVAKIERIEQYQRQKLDFKIVRQDKQKKQIIGIIEKVPMLTGSMIELTMQAKQILRLSYPPISVDPFIAKEEYKSSTEASEAWNNLITAIEKPPAQSKPNVKLRKAGQIQIDLGTRYSLLRGGKVSPADGSPVTKALNEILARPDENRMQELWGSKNPFKLKWSFQATNLTSGDRIPVMVNQPSHDAVVQVKVSGNNLPDGSVKISFPMSPANAIYELAIRADVVDSFGKSGVIEHRVYSHYLAGENEEEFVKIMLPTLATLADLSPSELVTASSLENIPDEKRIVMNPKSRRARMVRLLTMRYVQDNMITVPELRNLIKSTKLFGRNIY